MKQKLINLLIFSTVFISSYVFFKQPFEGYITYLVLALFLPVFISKYGIPKLPLMIFAPLAISGLIYVQTGDNEAALFTKIFIGFFSSVVFYYYVIQLYDFDIKRIFNLYLKGCVIVSIIGIIQIISYQVGFKFGYNYSWILNKWGYTAGGIGIRMNSIFSEPAYFAAVIAPAFFTSIQKLLINPFKLRVQWREIIIIIAYLLTFSSLGILGIFLTILFLLLNFGFFKYAIVFVPIFFFGFKYAYEEIPEFQERYDGTIEVFSKQNIRDYDVHGSSFVLYNNYHIATENFRRHPIFGTGLGSHAVAFEKYTLTNLDSNVVQITFNKADANSMFLRIMSETGLYGLIFIIIFFVKCWVFKQRSVDQEHWIISNALALIILLYLARQGHYFLNGFPLFLWMYYFNWKDNKELRDKAKKEAEENTNLQPVT
jgi:O-antigen ligase